MNGKNEIDEIFPEIKDILNRIKSFNISHPEGIFVFAFMGFKDSDEICEECGDHCQCVDNNKTIFGAHGSIYDTRELLNDLRDMVEDNSDEEGIVNF